MQSIIFLRRRLFASNSLYVSWHLWHPATHAAWRCCSISAIDRSIAPLSLSLSHSDFFVSSAFRAHATRALSAQAQRQLQTWSLVGNLACTSGRLDVDFRSCCRPLEIPKTLFGSNGPHLNLSLRFSTLSTTRRRSASRNATSPSASPSLGSSSCSS